MNLQQLYYFKTIAQLEHYTKAAEQLNVSQSRLSHAIGDLEKELQVTLFVHQGRNVKLTRCGAFLLEYVSQSLDILDRGLEKLSDFVNPDTGSIGLSYLGSLANFVTFCISRFFEKTGKVQVHFQFNQTVTQTIEDSLMEGHTDLAFTTPFDNKNIESVKIGSHKTILIVSRDHLLAAQDSVDLTTLANETFVTYSPQCMIRNHIDEIFQTVGIQPKISFEALYDSIVLGVVSANLGVALVAEAVDLTGCHVKALQIENEIPEREIHMAWVKDRYMTPAVKCFRDFIMESGMLLDQYKKK